MAETMKRFQVDRPQNVRYRTHGRTGGFQGRLEWDAGFAGRMQERLGHAQKVVDETCMARMTDARIHPFDTGALAASPMRNTVIGSGVIVQSESYARRQYYEHREKSRWFETMKNRDGDVILRTAQRALSGR